MSHFTALQWFSQLSFSRALCYSIRNCPVEDKSITLKQLRQWLETIGSSCNPRALMWSDAVGHVVGPVVSFSGIGAQFGSSRHQPLGDETGKTRSSNHWKCHYQTALCEANSEEIYHLRVFGIWNQLEAWGSLKETFRQFCSGEHSLLSSCELLISTIRAFRVLSRFSPKAFLVLGCFCSKQIKRWRKNVGTSVKAVAVKMWHRHVLCREAKSSNPDGKIGWRVELRTPEVQILFFAGCLAHQTTQKNHLKTGFQDSGSMLNHLDISRLICSGKEEFLHIILIFSQKNKVEFSHQFPLSFFRRCCCCCQAQATDFENAAVIAMARVLAQLILEERWDVYMAISKVEENLLRTEGLTSTVGLLAEMDPNSLYKKKMLERHGMPRWP